MFIRPPERNRRSIAKAVSWRVLGSADTFLLSVVVTGSFRLAGSIASIEVLTKTALYYLHERLWVRIPWGRDRSTPPARPDGDT